MHVRNYFAGSDYISKEALVRKSDPTRPYGLPGRACADVRGQRARIPTRLAATN